MEHGHVRNRTIKREYDTFSGVTSEGKKVEANYCSSELSVAEKYCKHCGEYVSTEAFGLIGFCICPQCKEFW